MNLGLTGFGNTPLRAPSTCLCVHPVRRYFYFTGAGMAERFASNYVVGSNASDVGSWVDEPCASTYSTLHTLCEFEVTGCTASPPAVPTCPMLGGVANDTNTLVDNAGNRVYVYNSTGGKNYAEAQAICAALTMPGVTGKAYLVTWGS